MPITRTPLINQVITFRTLQLGEDATSFRTLNEEWINRFFTLEPHDVEVLTNPEAEILAKGGQIYFAEAEGQIVACVALIPLLDVTGDPTGTYELSKMAVSPAMRGQGIGRNLITHTVAQARAFGAKSLFLGSSKRLQNAVHLYESVGFAHVPADSLPGINYTRADVFMVLNL